MAGGEVLLTSVLFIMLVIQPIHGAQTVYNALNKVGQAAAFATVRAANAEVISMTKVGNVVGLVFDLGIAWGFALYEIFSQHLDADPTGIAFRTVIVGAVAATVIALLLFAIGSSVIGAVIVSVLAFVDALLLVTCKLNGQQDCFSVTGYVTAALAQFFYSGDSTIDFEHKDAGGASDLISMRDISSRIAEPNLGMRAGNSIIYQAQIHTAISQKRADGTALIYPQDKYFGEDKLRQSAFHYQLTTDENGAGPPAELGDMSSSWSNIRPRCERLLFSRKYPRHQQRRDPVCHRPEPQYVAVYEERLRCAGLPVLDILLRR